MVHRVKKQRKVKVSLSPETMQKAKVLAAQRSTSISGLLSDQIESLVGQEAIYQHCELTALALLEKGFQLGGTITATRDDLHER